MLVIPLDNAQLKVDYSCETKWALQFEGYWGGTKLTVSRRDLPTFSAKLRHIIAHQRPLRRRSNADENFNLGPKFKFIVWGIEWQDIKASVRNRGLTNEVQFSQNDLQNLVCLLEGFSTLSLHGLPDVVIESELGRQTADE